MNFLALGITGYFFFQLYNGNYVSQGVSTIPNIKIPWISGLHFLGPAIGNLNLMIWASFALVIVSYIVVFKTPIGLRIRACGEHPRAADTVGINVYAVRYGAVVLSGVLAALGGVYLSDGFGGGAFTDNMTAGRGFIALAAMIFGNWRPFGAFGAALLFGFSSALAFRLQVYSASASTLFNVLPYVLTLIAVAGVIGRTVAPAADGKPYVAVITGPRSPSSPGSSPSSPCPARSCSRGRLRGSSCSVRPGRFRSRRCSASRRCCSRGVRAGESAGRSSVRAGAGACARQ